MASLADTMILLGAVVVVAATCTAVCVAGSLLAHAYERRRMVSLRVSERYESDAEDMELEAAREAEMEARHGAA